MSLSKKDIFLLVIVSFTSFVSVCLAFYLDNTFLKSISATFPFSLIVLLSLYLFRRYQALSHIQSTQIQANTAIYNFINPKMPFPIMNGRAMKPDSILKMIELVLEKKPSLVVEAGAGVSTLVIGYLLKQNNISGKIVSLEDHEEYCSHMTDLVKLHGLEDFVTISYSPLKSFVLNDESWKWYDFPQDLLESKIDILSVDGPPAFVQKLSRFPAVPLLSEAISCDTMIVLDDLKRVDEKSILKRWASTLKRDYLIHNTESGTGVIY